jgi:serine/threonine protein kinase
MFESIFGRLPFTGETVYEIAKAAQRTLEFPAGASPELRDLLAKMLCHDPAARIALARAAEHPFFAGEGDPVVDVATVPPQMKASSSLVSVAADVCGDDYVLELPPAASSWPALRGHGLRQFPQAAC